MVDLADINNNDTKSTKYIIKFLHKTTKEVTKKFLKPRNFPDIASIPNYSEYCINESNKFS